MIISELDKQDKIRRKISGDPRPKDIVKYFVKEISKIRPYYVQYRIFKNKQWAASLISDLNRIQEEI